MEALKLLLMSGGFLSAVTCTIGKDWKISGGIESTITKRPFQASLQYHNGTHITHACGASIISKSHLLTSARCDPGANIFNYYARVGSTAYDRRGQVLKVAAFVRHPNFTVDTLDYDFGIVSFSSGQEINLTEDIKPIALAESIEPPAEGRYLISGWGVLEENSSTIPINFREAIINPVDDVTCKHYYSFMTPRQFCLGGNNVSEAGACFGDIGGPAIIEMPENNTLYGVISGWNECASFDVPQIFASVYSAIDWIKAFTEN